MGAFFNYLYNILVFFTNYLRTPIDICANANVMTIPKYLRIIQIVHFNIRALEMAIGTGTVVANRGLIRGDQYFLIHLLTEDQYYTHFYTLFLLPPKPDVIQIFIFLTTSKNHLDVDCQK